MATKLVFVGILLFILTGLTSPACGQTSISRHQLVGMSSNSIDADGSSSASDSNAEADGIAVASLRGGTSKTGSVLPGKSSHSGPFSSWTIGIKADSLGAGIDLATPLSRRLGLRVQGNFFAFDYLFNIDGVDYDSRFNLRSGSLSLDWYPTHRSLRISPGVLYFKNNLNAVSGVPPGNYFELGTQGFINSVDDPLNGTASVIFPRHVAPMVTFGYNLIGKRESRITMPLELGVAYTGAAKIDVTLNGTACTNEGCFTFADNEEAQASLQEEIKKLNNNLQSYPVYPIVSIGVAYRFGR